VAVPRLPYRDLSGCEEAVSVRDAAEGEAAEDARRQWPAFLVVGRGPDPRGQPVVAPAAGRLDDREPVGGAELRLDAHPDVDAEAAAGAVRPHVHEAGDVPLRVRGASRHAR